MREIRVVRGCGVALIVLASIGCGGNAAADRKSANGGAPGVEGGVAGIDGGTPGVDGGAASVPASGGRGPALAGASSRGGADGMSGSAGAGGAAGAAGGTAGLSGMGAEDDCPKPNYDSCISSCFEESSSSDTIGCKNGSWACNPGFVLASSCPAHACRVTKGACCDSMTGAIKGNPCGSDGLRAACPAGATETSTYPRGSLCVPQSLTGQKCISLDQQPCAGPAYYCFDTDPGFVKCTCSGIATDSGRGDWHCASYLGG